MEGRGASNLMGGIADAARSNGPVPHATAAGYLHRTRFVPRRIMVRLVLLAVVLSCGATYGCFRGRRAPPAAAPHPGAPQTEVALTVTNRHWLDVVIYVVHDGQRSRVGTVTASSSQLFLLQPWMLGQGRQIRLVGHPIGGAANAATDLLIIQPGQYIEWTLETNLQHSTVGVF